VRRPRTGVGRDVHAGIEYGSVRAQSTKLERTSSESAQAQLIPRACATQGWQFSDLPDSSGLGGSGSRLALVNLGIDSKLRGCDLVSLRVRDLCHGDQVAAHTIVVQHKTQRPVRHGSGSQG